MQVVKRSGKQEQVSFDKITARIKKLCYGLNSEFVDSIEIAKRVIQGLYDGVTTVELDNLAAETAATMATIHPDYALLAARTQMPKFGVHRLKGFVRSQRNVQNYYLSRCPAHQADGRHTDFHLSKRFRRETFLYPPARYRCASRSQTADRRKDQSHQVMRSGL